MKQEILNAETKMALYGLAGKLNNHPKHVLQDKVTIMAFMDMEEARTYCLGLLAEIEG